MEGHLISSKFIEYEHAESSTKHPLYQNMIVGTCLWMVLAFILALFMPANAFSLNSWLPIIFSDIACLIIVRFKKFNINNIYLYSMLTGLAQMTYMLHAYDFHIVYLLLMVGTTASVTNSMMHSENKQIWIYGICTTLCALSILLIRAPYTDAVAFGYAVGIIFYTSSTLSNKKLKNENIRIRTQLEEAMRYAHDINSPLLVVKGRLGQVLKGDLTDEQRRKLTIAENAADKIAKIVTAVT